MRAILLAFLLIPFLCTAQHVRIIPGIGYSGVLGDSKSRMDYAYSLGVGIADSLTHRISGEVSLSYVHSSFRQDVDGHGHKETTMIGSTNATGLAIWRTNADEHSTVLAIGLFGSRVITDVKHPWGYGPVAGVGIAWPTGRLLIEVQSNIERFGTGRDILGLATLGINIF